MCSTTMALTNSLIDTTGKGCESETGLGAGIKVAGCAASGAAHGGMGGAGA